MDTVVKQFVINLSLTESYVKKAPLRLVSPSYALGLTPGFYPDVSVFCQILKKNILYKLIYLILKLRFKSGFNIFLFSLTLGSLQVEFDF